MNPVEDQITKHCSVRNFTDKPIDEKLLHRLIECGQMASSSSFMQAYSVIRVRNKKQRRRIAKAAGRQSWVENAAEFLVICADLLRVERCCVQTGYGVLHGHTEHFIAATVDAALFAQNMLLAAEANGLGGVFIGGVRNNPKLVAKVLQIPDQVYPVFGLCLGWPVDTGQPKPRMPVSAILHEEHYHAENIAGTVADYDEVMESYYATRNANRRQSNWSQQTASDIQGKRREHMLKFLQARGLLKC